jgi:hypothetical protein
MGFCDVFYRAKHPMKTTVFKAVAFALISSILLRCPCFAAHTGDDGDGFSLAAAVAEAKTAQFAPAFIDSLRRANLIIFTPRMRTLDRMPLPRQETLVYACSWGPIRAGYGVVALKSDSSCKGRLEMAAQGVSNNFISAFFRMRDHLRCIIDSAGFYPHFFEEHIREGRYKADRWILFDPAAGRCYTQKKNYESVESPPYAQSILSVLFRLRTLQFAPGDTFSIDCFVQHKNYRVKFRCIRSEVIKIDLGQFSCLLIEPELEGEGRVFTKKDKLRIWLNTDPYHTPVFIKSKLGFGSLSVQLQRFEQE